MSEKTTKYMLYIALILGSIGTYNALLGSSSPTTTTTGNEETIASALENGDLTRADLTEMLTQLSRKVDENAQAKKANTSTIVSVNEKAADLRTDFDSLISKVDDTSIFVQNFNNEATPLHNKLVDMESKVDALTSFEESNVSTPVDIDTDYVTNLSKRLSLVETSNKTSKEAAFSARDETVVNTNSIIKLKNSIDSLTTQIASVNQVDTKVTQLTEKVDGSSSNTAISAVTTRVNSLTSENEALAARLIGVETWVNNRTENAKAASVTSETGVVTQAVLDRIVDVESLADTNSVNLLTITGNVDTNTADIGAFIPDLQEQISINKSEISSVLDKADTTISTIANIVTPRISDNEADIVALQSKDLEWKRRIEIIEESQPIADTAREILGSDIVSVSERVTKNLVAIGNIEDALESVFTEKIESNKANIASVADDANFLAQKFARIGDEAVSIGVLNAQNGAKIALKNNFFHYAAPNDNNWMLYRSNGKNGAIAGESRIEGFGFSGNASRIRIGGGISEGFIIENSNDELMFSMRGSDSLAYMNGRINVGGVCFLQTNDDGNAQFSHRLYQHSNVAAIKQEGSGNTLLSCKAGKGVVVNNGDNKVASFVNGKSTFETELIVNHASGTHDTHFRADSNYISTGSGKRTYFRFGGSNPSVNIRDKEVNIDGVDVLAKLKSLEARVRTLETDYVRRGDTYVINGHKDGWSAELGYAGDDARWSRSNTRMTVKIVKP